MHKGVNIGVFLKSTEMHLAIVCMQVVLDQHTAAVACFALETSGFYHIQLARLHVFSVPSTLLQHC